MRVKKCSKVPSLISQSVPIKLLRNFQPHRQQAAFGITRMDPRTTPFINSIEEEQGKKPSVFERLSLNTNSCKRQSQEGSGHVWGKKSNVKHIKVGPPASPEPGWHPLDPANPARKKVKPINFDSPASPDPSDPVQKNVYVCSECGFWAQMVGRFHGHLIAQHPLSSWADFRCSVCDFKSPDRPTVVSHIQADHGSSSDAHVLFPRVPENGYADRMKTILAAEGETTGQNAQPLFPSAEPSAVIPLKRKDSWPDPSDLDVEQLKEEEAGCKEELKRLDAEIREGKRRIVEAAKDTGHPAELRARLAQLEKQQEAKAEGILRLAGQKEWIANRLSDLAVRKIRAELALSESPESEETELELEEIELEIEAARKVQHQLDEEAKEEEDRRESIRRLLATTRQELSAALAALSARIAELKYAQRDNVLAYTEANTRRAKFAYLITIANAHRWQKDWLDQLKLPTSSNN